MTKIKEKVVREKKDLERAELSLLGMSKIVWEGQLYRPEGGRNLENYSNESEVEGQTAMEYLIAKGIPEEVVEMFIEREGLSASRIKKVLGKRIFFNGRELVDRED